MQLKLQPNDPLVITIYNGVKVKQGDDDVLMRSLSPALNATCSVFFSFCILRQKHYNTRSKSRCTTCNCSGIKSNQPLFINGLSTFFFHLS